MAAVAPAAPEAAVELLPADLSRSGETYCPNPRADMQLWNAHPRVFLRFADGEAKCPYCGTVYRVRGGAVAAGR